MMREFCSLLFTSLFVAFFTGELRSYPTTPNIDWGFYIGASDSANEGVWKWIDDSSVSYTNWWPWEPNSQGADNNEDCVMYQNLGTLGVYFWNDIRCSNSMGFICQKDINECDSNPCENGATCHNLINMYSCSCVPGFTGLNCETDIDECESHPCQNNGICNDRINHFTCSCTDRYIGTVCEKDCRPGPADILFVVDTSDSTRMNISKNFLSNFIEQIPIGIDDFLVSVLTFSWNITLQFSFTDHVDNTSLIDAIKNMSWEGGPTLTGKALEEVDKIVTDSSNGRRGAVELYIVLLTDGMSSDRNEAISKANIITRKGLNLMAIGVGKLISHDELLQMVSTNQHLFSIDNDDLLHLILKDTSHRDCSDCLQRTESDVLFLMEVPETTAEISMSTQIMRETSYYLRFESNDIQIGMVLYEQTPTIEFSLSKYRKYENLNSALTKIQIRKYSPNITNALKFAREDGFSQQNGGRDESRKILVIISSGDSWDYNTTKIQIKQLIFEGYRVVIVLSKLVEDFVENVIEILPQTFGFIYAGDKEFFSSLQAVVSESMFDDCPKNIFQKRVS